MSQTTHRRPEQTASAVQHPRVDYISIPEQAESLSRLQWNYYHLVALIAELAHSASEERRAHLLGECSLNLPDEALHDIKNELVFLRASEQALEVAA